MTKKFEITIKQGAAPKEASTPTQTVAPSQVTRPNWDKSERQSMINEQAGSIRDEQAEQGISIPWSEALSQANEEWKSNTEITNALFDTEHESIVTSASQDAIPEEIAAPEIFSSSNDANYFGPIDTDSMDSAAIEEALDGIFDNINEVIEGYDPTGRPESNMPARWWEAEMAQENAKEEAAESAKSEFGEGTFGDKALSPVTPTSTPPFGTEDDSLRRGLRGSVHSGLETLEEKPGIGFGDDSMSGGDMLGMKPDFGRRAWQGELSAVVEAGVGGSSRSAATAIQSTGSMITHPLKTGRDAMAQQLEQSAMGAKVLAAMASGGEVVPTSDGGEGGDGDGGDILGSLGGDGDGDGGGLGDMIGESIDDIFAAPLKPVDMFIDAIEGTIDKLSLMTSAIEESYEEVMGFSAAMIGARVETDLAILQRQMERGQELGQEFASFEDARGDLLLAFEDLKTVLLKIFLPIIKVALKILTKILNMIVRLLETILSAYDFIVATLISIVAALQLAFMWSITISVILAGMRWGLNQIVRNTAPAPTTFDALGGWLQNPNAAIPVNLPLP